MFNFTSSAIDNIVMNDAEVMITFRGGRDYTYSCADIEGFRSDLQNVIEEQESVGSFVNRAIRAELLELIQQPVAV